MSQTLPVDVVSRSYWAYVASAMAEGLDKILRNQGTSESIPRRVFVDAQHFFQLALEAAGDALPQNPSASISNYILAANAAKALPESPADRPALETCLQAYSDLLTKLQAGQPLSPSEETLASRLKQFFTEVQQEAEAEAYDKVVQFEPPPTTLKLF